MLGNQKKVCKDHVGEVINFPAVMTYPHGFEHLNIFFIFVVAVTGHSTRAAICDVTGCFCPGVPDVLTFTCQSEHKNVHKFLFARSKIFNACCSCSCLLIPRESTDIDISAMK